MTVERHDEEKSATPRDAYPCQVVRDWDRRAIDEYGIPGVVLMENAGAGAARVIMQLMTQGSAPLRAPFSVFCGPGNNGGDGFVVARHLSNHGHEVHVTVVGARGYPSGSDAGVNYEIVKRMKIPMTETGLPPRNSDEASTAQQKGTYIDALFGTGLSRPLESPYHEWVQELTKSPCPVIALDIPSGLNADSGEALGAALPAAHTITFAARKLGFFKGVGPQMCGSVHVVDIGMPRTIWTAESEKDG